MILLISHTKMLVVYFFYLVSINNKQLTKDIFVSRLHQGGSV